ncbi:MAG: Crp/Fnr family transcriptional regulator [Rhodobacter sp.]|nr:Crp/Fnr family transcriptional regulator [Rhodobacter sp.]
MARGSKEEIARRSLLLRNLPELAVDVLIRKAVWKTYDRGATVFLQGETATSIHIVIQGWAKIYRIAANGSEAVVNVFTKGGSFGEAVALRGLPYPVSAETVTECEIMHIPATALTTLIRHDPEIAITILAATFVHLQSLVEQIEQMKAQTGAQRVAEFLLELCNRRSGSCVVNLPYDKILIAGRLGMKPESLSRAFSKLRVVGVLVEGSIAAIEDVAKLHDYCEEDPAAAWNRAL